MVVKKRSYLADFKSLTVRSSLQLFLNQLLKSTVITFTPLYIEYVKYLEIENNKDDSDDNDTGSEEEQDFDLGGKLQRLSPVFVEVLFRNVMVEMVIARAFSNFAIQHLSSRYADKLVKSVNNSLKRKLIKYNTFEACKRGFFTFVNGGAIPTLSFLTYDVYNQIAENVVGNGISMKSLTKKVPVACAWVAKVCIWHVGSLVLGSLGKSVGIFLLKNSLGITAGTLLGEFVLQQCQMILLGLLS